MDPAYESQAYVSLTLAERRRVERRALGLQLVFAGAFTLAGLTGLIELDGAYGLAAVLAVALIQVPVSWYILALRLHGKSLPIPDLTIPVVGIATITLAWTAMADQTSPTWAIYLIALVAYSRRHRGRQWAILMAWTLANVAAAITYLGVRDDGGPVVEHAAEIVGYIFAAGVLANMLSSAWRRAEQIAREQAASDALTGLPNRRTMLTELDRLTSRPRAAASVVMVDLDDFKRVNDGQGHAAGDEALIEVAHCLRGAIRAGDIVGRYGGEEFLVLLPRTGLGDALVVAERVRAAVAASGTVTVSAGVAEREFLEASAALIHRADAELLRAKREGKNRVCAAPQRERAAA